MNYQNIKVPFLVKGKISNAAEQFRREYWDDTIPVDIEKIISVNLRMDIIIVPNLFRLCNTDALITSDWEQLHVDYDLFYADRNNNRLRFSYAHEIGHLMLHRNLYKDFKINDFETFVRFYNEISNDQYHYLETQANIFANYLLIPRNKLAEIKAKVLKKFLSDNKINLSEIDPKILNQYLAGPISKFFGVSPIPVEIALSDLT